MMRKIFILTLLFVILPCFLCAETRVDGKKVESFKRITTDTIRGNTGINFDPDKDGTNELNMTSTGYLHLGADDLLSSLFIHDAGYIDLYDDSDDFTVRIGPVANGTTTLGITGSIDASGDLSGATIGGITEANLVDKSAAETISGIWEFGRYTSFGFENDTAAVAPYIRFNRAKSGPADVVDGSYLGDLRFYGYGSGVYQMGAMIISAVDGSPGADETDMPSSLLFQTAPDDSVTPVTRMKIGSSGAIDVLGGALNIGVADTTDAILNLYGDNADTGPTVLFYNSVNEDGTEEYWKMEPQGTNFWFGAVSDPDQFIFSNAGNFTASGNVAGATYGSDASISNAELLTIDNGATTEIPVGGGAGSAMVWTTATGTGAPVRAGSPTFTTQITSPSVIGSSADNGDLTLTGTSSATKTTSNIALQSGGGNVQIGTTTEAGTSGQRVIVIGGTATDPTTSPADVFQLWTKDFNGAASYRLYGRTEEGNSQPIALLTESQIAYGVAWNETTDSYTRLGRTTGHKVGATLPVGMLPIQEAMKRCLLADAGTVNYFLDPNNSAYKVNGSTASTLTGADGQVMVRIPKFWYRYNYIAPVHYWEISPVALSDFTAHEAFYKDGAWVDFRYIGAYEGVLQDVSIDANSVSEYVDGMYQPTIAVVFETDDDSITATALMAPFTYLSVGQKITVSGTVSNDATLTVASLVSDTVITVSENLTDETDASCIITTEKDTTATTGDKLSSVSGKRPINYLTRANFRTIAANRGSGWRQMDYDLVSAIQLLFLTEYASFYSQNMIGVGITNVADWTACNNSNPIVRTGNSNTIGNATGNTAGSTTCAAEVADYMSYRGIENWYGHMWKWVDGFNINGNIPYITNNTTDWADDTATNYTRPTDVLGTSITMHNADGYAASLKQISRGFLPASVGASSSTKLTDYYYQSTGWRMARLGGGASNSEPSGGFFWSLANDSTYASQGISGRLVY